MEYKSYNELKAFEKVEDTKEVQSEFLKVKDLKVGDKLQWMYPSKDTIPLPKITQVFNSDFRIKQYYEVIQVESNGVYIYGDTKEWFCIEGKSLNSFAIPTIETAYYKHRGKINPWETNFSYKPGDRVIISGKPNPSTIECTKSLKTPLKLLIEHKLISVYTQKEVKTILINI